jgi:hypothetical protein
MFVSCSLVNIWSVKLVIMFDSCAGLTVWSVKLVTMFDSCSVVKHLEREASQYV